MGVLWGKIGEGVVRYWPPTNSFLLFGVLTSVPILVKIDQEMRPWECSQTDRQTHRQTDRHTHTDGNRFYNLSHAICYSYGTDNEVSFNVHCVYWNQTSLLPALAKFPYSYTGSANSRRRVCINRPSCSAACADGLSDR